MVGSEFLPQFGEVDAAALAVGAGRVLHQEFFGEPFPGDGVGPLEVALGEVPGGEAPYHGEGLHVGRGAQVVVLFHFLRPDDTVVKNVIDCLEFLRICQGQGFRPADDEGLEVFAPQDGSESQAAEMAGTVHRGAGHGGEPLPCGADADHGNLPSRFALRLPQNPVGGRGRLPPKGRGRFDGDGVVFDGQVGGAVRPAGDNEGVDARLPERHGQPSSGVGFSQLPCERGFEESRCFCRDGKEGAEGADGEDHRAFRGQGAALRVAVAEKEFRGGRRSAEPF